MCLLLPKGNRLTIKMVKSTKINFTQHPQKCQLLVEMWRCNKCRTNAQSSLIERLHDPANVQQTSSISTCILNTFAGSLLEFAKSCKHPINQRWLKTCSPKETDESHTSAQINIDSFDKRDNSNSHNNTHWKYFSTAFCFKQNRKQCH